MHNLAATYTRYLSTASLEIQNGWSAILTGAYLLLPFNTFNSAAAYRFFNIAASENVWGVTFLLLGCFQIVSSMLDLVIVRRISSSILGLLFLLYILGIATGNPYSLAIPFVVPMVIGQVWTFFQVRKVR